MIDHNLYSPAAQADDGLLRWRKLLGLHKVLRFIDVLRARPVSPWRAVFARLAITEGLDGERL